MAIDALLTPLKLLVRTYLGGSFGAGFLGPRADPGWPRGVQEDDDVRWAWTPTATAGPDGAPGPELMPVMGRTRRRR